MDEQQMAAFMALSPEEKQAYFSQQQQAVDPRMGQPGKGGLTPQQKMDGADPRMFDDYAGQGAIIDDQQAQAEELRNTATPQGMSVGNQYVAGNPLEHIVSGVKQYQGNRDAKAAMAAKKLLSETIGSTQMGAAQNVMDKNKATSLADQLRANAGNGIEFNPKMNA